MACAALRREGAVARGLRRVGARWVCGIFYNASGCTLSWPSYPVIIIIIFRSVPSFQVFTVRARLGMGRRLQDQRAMEHQPILQDCTLESFRLNSTLRRRKPLHRPRLAQ